MNGERRGNILYTYIYTHIYVYIHIHTMEYYSAIEKNEILLFAANSMDLEGIMLSGWMDLEGIMLSEMSQTE